MICKSLYICIVHVVLYVIYIKFVSSAKTLPLEAVDLCAFVVDKYTCYVEKYSVCDLIIFKGTRLSYEKYRHTIGSDF